MVEFFFFIFPINGWHPLPKNIPGGSIRKLPTGSFWLSTIAYLYFSTNFSFCSFICFFSSLDLDNLFSLSFSKNFIISEKSQSSSDEIFISFDKVFFQSFQKFLLNLLLLTYSVLIYFAYKVAYSSAKGFKFIFSLLQLIGILCGIYSGGK